MGRGAGVLSQENRKVEGRGHTSASAPGCGFVLLSLQAGLKEAGNSSGLFPPRGRVSPELLWGGWDLGRELISAYRPEHNWQLHMSFRNKTRKASMPFLINAVWWKQRPSFLGGTQWTGRRPQSSRSWAVLRAGETFKSLDHHHRRRHHPIAVSAHEGGGPLSFGPC